MFGVNERGEDTLAPQFKKRPGAKEGRGDFESTQGFRLLTESNVRFLRACGFLETRKTVLQALKENGILPADTDIDQLAEEELQARAEKLAREARDHQAQIASRAAILRT